MIKYQTQDNGVYVTVTGEASFHMYCSLSIPCFTSKKYDRELKKQIRKALIARIKNKFRIK